MNTEELKMVMEAVTRMSDTAGNAAQWWLALHYGQKILSDLFVLIGIVGGVTVFATSLRAVIIGADEWARLGKRVAKRMGGDGTDYSCNRDSERIEKVLSTFEQMARDGGVK